MRFLFPSKEILHDQPRLHDYFWSQREAWHSEALAGDCLTESEREWHKQRLEHAISKLSSGWKWGR